MNNSSQNKVISFPRHKIDPEYLDREELRNFCFQICGRFEAIAEQCSKGEADETDIIKKLEKAIIDIKEKCTVHK